jgi:hypothetical protein
MPEETYVPLFSEICTKINNAKDKPKKIGVLRHYRTPAFEMFLKAALDPSIEWLLPVGDVPFMANDAPEGTEHTRLSREMLKCHNYVKMNRNRVDLAPVVGNPNLNTAQREMMFIQMLEGLHSDEAELIILAKNKDLNKTYKGLTASAVCEAYGWTEHFEPLGAQ